MNASATRFTTGPAASVDGILTVRRCVHIAASHERVWREFEDFKRLSAWWGTGHRLVAYEPRAGGRIEMEVDVDGAPQRFGGTIVVFDPGRELTWEDNWIGPLAWSSTVYSTLRLTPVAGGGTVVEFIKHGFERLGNAGPQVHRGLEGGWSVRQLGALRDIVEGAAAEASG